MNRGRRARARALFAGALVVGVLGLAPEAGAQAAACRDGVQGERAAVALAEECGTEVEVLDQRTATGSYFAQPDGSMTYRSSGDNWTTVRSCAPNTSYWTTRRDSMRVGNDPSQPSCVHRVFVNIPLDGLEGVQVNHATFRSHLDHTAPCASPTPSVRLAVTTQTWIQPGANVTWNNTSDYATYRGWVVGSASPPSANESGACGRDLGDKWVDFPMSGGDLQWFTDRAYPNVTFQMYSATETLWTTWKKFYAGSSHLEINFESAE